MDGTRAIRRDPRERETFEGRQTGGGFPFVDRSMRPTNQIRNDHSLQVLTDELGSKSPTTEEIQIFTGHTEPNH